VEGWRAVMSDQPHRCRLCTTTDLTSLRDHMARTIWSGRDEILLEEAGPYWNKIYRELANDALRGLGVEPPE
jgi:hypothetical protein